MNALRRVPDAPRVAAMRRSERRRPSGRRPVTHDFGMTTIAELAHIEAALGLDGPDGLAWAIHAAYLQVRGEQKAGQSRKAVA